VIESSLKEGLKDELVRTCIISENIISRKGGIGEVELLGRSSSRQQKDKYDRVGASIEDI
jgi:hypothetical protein